MKRLFTILSLFAIVALGLVSCNPDSVDLHPRVGEVYKDKALYGELDGDGIIFYVDGDSALICSLSDLKVNRFANNASVQRATWDLMEVSWNTFGRDTVLEKDTNMAKIIRDKNKLDVEHQALEVTVYPRSAKTTPFYVRAEAMEGKEPCWKDSIGFDTTANEIIYMDICDTIFNRIEKGDKVLEADVDSSYYFGLIGANHVDGRINTEIIIKADIPKQAESYDSTASAAMYCKTYFHKQYLETKALDAKDTAYIKTKGMWYLPSIEELRHLFDAKNKINDLNGGVKGFGVLKNCYWASTERDGKNAWYKCFTDNGVESYIPKAGTTHKIPVRAIRKVKL